MKLSSLFSLSLLFIIGVSFAQNCPPFMSLVQLNTNPQQLVCVDQYEAAVVEIVNGTEIPHPFNQVVDGLIVKAIVQKGIDPQAYISGDEAAQACKLAGKHLCTLEEWLSACQGPLNNTFPYGNKYQKGYCNEGRPVNPVIELFGKNASFDWTEMNDPRLDLLPDTYAFNEFISYYENYDMHGNLDEWVDHLNENGHGTFKGGYFVDASINGPGCLYRTIAHDTDYHDYSLGFRCCAPPT